MIEMSIAKEAIMDQKALTLRLPAEQAEALEKVAEIDAVSVTEAIREAIDEHIAQRVTDEEFQRRLKASMDRHQRILDRLAKA
jgi:predicted DNA-binding protein